MAPQKAPEDKTRIGRAYCNRKLAKSFLRTGHPDHEKFIEITGKNGQEFDTLQQRITLITGLFQDPAVEFQPA